MACRSPDWWQSIVLVIIIAKLSQLRLHASYLFLKLNAPCSLVLSTLLVVLTRGGHILVWWG